MAPSFGCNIEPYRSAFDNALKTWQQMGYHTVLGPNCYEGNGIGISNTPEKCGAEVNHFFAEENCDIILSCGGGGLMCEVVSHIDFERIARAKAKWYMGFSDNTNLTFLLPTLCDTAAIYGPCAPAFGMREWHPALKDAWGLLSGRITEVHGYPLWERESLKDEEHPLEPYNVTEEKKLLIEAFLFGYSGNAYGEKVRINLKKFRRPEQKFDGIDALKRQIDKDIAKGMEYFGIV